MDQATTWSSTPQKGCAKPLAAAAQAVAWLDKASASPPASSASGKTAAISSTASGSTTSSLGHHVCTDRKN